MSAFGSSAEPPYGRVCLTARIRPIPPAEYDAAVIGLGVMGGAALYQLARRGAKVCGFDVHEPPHALGSSHGRLRVIRKAYFEHPDYIPLLDRAYAGWRELEADCGATLFVEHGMILAGPHDAETIAGLDLCYSKHDLPHERLTAAEARARFPQFAIPDKWRAYYDPISGYVHVERAVAQQLDMARRHGAEMRCGVRAMWTHGPQGVAITAGGETFLARKVVLAPGPWAPELMGDVNVPLRVLRKVQLWYDAPAENFQPSQFPLFFIEHPYGQFYGFPSIDGAGLKVAQHSGGAEVKGPGDVARDLLPGDEEPVLRFIGDTFRGLSPRRKDFSVCLYTMTPDGHFLLGPHPRQPNAYIAAGFSGHGFKFAPVVGEAIADWVLAGRTNLPVDFLSPQRFRS
ncbi:MAG: N-methyl-L-tryptophan oxidase [Candidatus Hydrogenedentales bacterium]